MNNQKSEQMSKADIEKEVQARVEFKMNELMTAVENSAKLNLGISITHASQKNYHYWEAFKKVKEMFAKEMTMAVPCDEMSEMNKRQKRNEAIERIMDRFCKRGEKDYLHKEQILVKIIEDAQNW